MFVSRIEKINDIYVLSYLALLVLNSLHFIAAVLEVKDHFHYRY